MAPLLAPEGLEHGAAASSEACEVVDSADVALAVELALVTVLELSVASVELALVTMLELSVASVLLVLVELASARRNKANLMSSSPLPASLARYAPPPAGSSATRFCAAEGRRRRGGRRGG